MRFYQAVSTYVCQHGGWCCLPEKKPHRIITLRFSEVVKDHANIFCGITFLFVSQILTANLMLIMSLYQTNVSLYALNV